MSTRKDRRRQRALERLTATIATDLAEGRTITFDQRMSYNGLKRNLSLEGRI